VIKLDNRCRLILEKLLASSSPVSALELSRSLNLTPRKVRYSIKKAKLWLTERGSNLNANPGEGFQVIATSDEKSKLRRELDQEPTMILYSQDYRRYYLIFTLLNSTSPIVIKQFQYKIKCSRTTIIKDLNWVEIWLNKFKLSLIRKQNYGCYIEGMEKDKRDALVACIIENAGEIKLLEIIGNIYKSTNSTRRLMAKYEQDIVNFLPDLNLAYFINLVNLLQDLSGEKYTDKSYILIVLHLAFMVKRVRNNFVVEDFHRPLFGAKQKKYYSLATTIAENIKQTFKIKIPDQEILFITHLLGDLKIKRSITEEIEFEDFLAFNTGEVFEIVGSILNNASLYLHPTLKLDKELIQSLLFQIISMIPPSPSNEFNKNPILDEVKKSYPYIFKVTKESVSCLEPILNRPLSEDEISFIAMHLAAAMEKLRFPSKKRIRIIIVCNAGIATSNLLVSRIKAEFNEVEVVEVLSFLEYQQRKELVDFDLVISTLPIESWEKPSILVSPLLDEESIERIRNSIREQLIPQRQNTNPLSYSQEFGLNKLLLPTTISLQVSLKTWEEVVDHAGNLLIDVSAIEPNYIEAMKRMLIVHGPYMVIMPGIALLHAYPDDGVKTLGMSLVTLKSPVSFGHKEFDPVSIVIALCTTDNVSHIQALSDLVRLLQDNKAIEIIRKTYHKSRVLQLISKYSSDI